MDIFDNISPLDYRYYMRDEAVYSAINPYLSEKARIAYQLRVECAFIKALEKLAIAPKGAYKEVEKACAKVEANEVYAEEDRIRHDVRALTNLIRSGVSERVKPFVHLGLTSNDVINTADSLRFRDFSLNVLVPQLKEFIGTLIGIAERERKSVQIGRTHGQHAVPITFGFAIAGYVSRMGNCMQNIERAANDMRGMISGAVGAYNALSLFVKDPIKLEADALKELEIKPAGSSTQIIEPEYSLRLLYACAEAFGVIANLADDMRHLQRTEIGEVGEATGKDQVGSSTMPHKKNPITFENAKSMWKVFVPRMMSAFMDQISEHQRDLTNSASSRFYPEMLAGLYIAARKVNATMKKLTVDMEACRRNVAMSSGLIVAEPLYILLAYHGHKDAHEAVRRLANKSRDTGRPAGELLKEDKQLAEYYNRFSEEQKEILERPEKYKGLAAQKTREICDFWRKRLEL